jgi:hypothetical protein
VWPTTDFSRAAPPIGLQIYVLRASPVDTNQTLKRKKAQRGGIQPPGVRQLILGKPHFK